MRRANQLIVLILIAGCFESLSAQNDCMGPNAQSDLAVNNVRARLKNSGELWWDNSEGRYIVPKAQPGQPEVAAIFAGGLWIGGFDEQGNLKLAAQTYGAGSDEHDYFAGPLDEQGQTSNDQCNNFDRIWKVNSTDIITLQQDWNDNGVIDNSVPVSLLKWPARGNPHFFSQNGFDLPDQDLAPFYDQNNDGVYDPYNGDYPDIHEADEGQWMVFNDNGSNHTDSGGPPLGVEIHLLAFAYTSTENAINDATFYEYTIINKSGELLDSVFAALWIDADLGCYTDDYIGCSPQRNLAYAYNRDAIDGDNNCNCQGVATYCDEIPLVGIKLLNGVSAGRNFAPDGTLVTPPIGQAPDTTVRLGMTSFMYYRNANSNAHPATIDPGGYKEYYNLMTGRWRDGRPLTSGGTGYNPLSTDTVYYAFPDNPAGAGGWTMCSAGIPTTDPRMVISSGPFRMEAGAVNAMSFAVIFQANVPHPCPDVSGLEAIADDVHFFYDGTVFTAAEEPGAGPAMDAQIVPNIIIDRAFVKLPVQAHGQVSLDIFTVQGQWVRHQEGAAGIEGLLIERDGMTSGMYFCRIKDEKGKNYVGRFIIQ